MTNATAEHPPDQARRPKRGRPKKTDKPYLRRLQIGAISLTGDTQPRVNLDPELVADYEACYRAGIAMPPIDVYFDGETYFLTDGFHRWHGARNAGLEEINCKVHHGSLPDARWASYAANQTHGQRRSNADKRKAVLAALRHPNGAKMSDHQIAEHVGVDHKTVSAWRAELESTREIPQSEKRTGRDGRTINTSKIGRGAPNGDVDQHPGDGDGNHDQRDGAVDVGLFNDSRAREAMAEIGTPLWAERCRKKMQDAILKEKDAVIDFRDEWREFVENKGWALLVGDDGQPFPDHRVFAMRSAPQGLGMEARDFVRHCVGAFVEPIPAASALTEVESMPSGSTLTRQLRDACEFWHANGISWHAIHLALGGLDEDLPQA